MNANKQEVPRHPIRVVAKRTGLTPAVLRAWEKRYGVVVPSRTDGGQRLYTDADVQRLSLLRKVVEEGRAISHVAHLSLEELGVLVREDAEERRTAQGPEPVVESGLEAVLARAYRAVSAMDPAGLERTLTRAALSFPLPVVADGLVSPLLDAIGTSWREGRLGPAHEHLSAVVIRRFLEWLLSTVDVGEDVPILLTGTPAGERHELGALLTAVSGAAEGWKCYFLGPDLPAEEIARAAVRLEAEVVGLSLVDEALAPTVAQEILDLRGRLPADVHLLLGGPLAIAKRELLEADGIEVLPDLASMRETLRARSRGA
jgi:DNA-binding transcriptional MerR regulator/methylmalonyl-CoA mutase cobalamin-binding subunit